MEITLHPVCVVTAVPCQAGIKFLHPRTQYEISSYIDEVWAVIGEANGYLSREAIVKKLKQFDPELLDAIIDDLIEIEVLVDSREYAQHFHGFTNNPMPFGYNMSFEDVAEYTQQARLPIFDGVSFPLARSVATTTRRISQDRKSCRSFAAGQLDLERLGAILRGSYLVEGEVTPSAGGLYPLKLYVIVVNNGSIPIGYYEYDSVKQELILYKADLDRENLEFAFNSDSLLYGAGNILVIGADVKRHMGKYSNRGYRYTLIEAGHVAQNVQLICNELGLGCLEYGGFQDTVLADELLLTEAGITPLITLAFGDKSKEAQYDSTLALAQLESSLVGRGKPVRYVVQTGGGRPENGESFFSASALHKANPQQDARRSYSQRFVGGTGTSASIAMVKAIAEAYERYASGDIRIDARSTATALTTRWIDPRLSTPLSDDQFAAMPWLARFDERAEYEWIAGYSLSYGDVVLAPIDLVYYPVFEKNLKRKPIYEGNSSGVAAHTSKEEAEKRALLEAIERDALMRTWFSRTPPPRIKTCALPYHWRKRVRFWAERGYSVHVFDISRYGVSVTSVVVVSEDNYPAFVHGASASLDSFERSVAKAFHEAELVLLHMMSHSNARRIDPMQVHDPMDHARFYADHSHLDNLRWMWSGDETSEVQEPSATLGELYAQLDAIGIRLSQENAPLYVVRVISDQLVPINFGYGSEHHLHRTLEGNVNPESIKLPHFFA